MGLKETYSENTQLVSILVPCYNHEKYILNTLESIASSDYKQIEIILIDDASLDQSFRLAKEWLELHGERFKRVVCVEHKVNRGICATFNELYQLSTGEYITYLASDDLLLPEAISNQVKHSERQEVDFIFSDCQLIDESSIVLARSALQYFGKNKKILCREYCLLVDIVMLWEAPWQKIFMKSSLMKQIGGFDENLCFEDRDFILRILGNGSFGFIPEATFSYRIRLHDRLTPGLTAEKAISDFHRAEYKNYLNSSGVIKVLLGCLVYSRQMKERRYINQSFIPEPLLIKIANCAKNFVTQLHKFMMHY